ncbi:MAG: ribosome maturation factor RimM [Cytophagales bacterium]
MNFDDYFELGFITRVHGTLGEVVAELDTDRPQKYKKLPSVFLLQKGQLIPYFIEKINISANNAIIKFEDVNSHPKAFDLKGTKLFLPAEKLTDRGEGHFYYHEIIGFELIDEEKGSLGPIKEVYSLEHSDLLAIEIDGKEVLIPIVDSFLKKIDKRKKQILMALPDGLIEIYTETAGKQDDGLGED